HNPLDSLRETQQKARRIVSIYPLSVKDSLQYQFVCVTDTGVRLFYRVQLKDERFFHLGTIRPPPHLREKILPLQLDQMQSDFMVKVEGEEDEYRVNHVESALFHEHICVMCLRGEENESTVLGCAVDCHKSYACEEHTALQFPQPILSASSFLDFTEIDSIYNATPAWGQEIWSQHYTQPKRFTLLTRQGCYRIMKNRPIDTLSTIAEDLETGRSRSQNRLESFRTLMGDYDCCVSALILACMCDVWYKNSPSKERMIQMYTKIFFDCAEGNEMGTPISRDSNGQKNLPDHFSAFSVITDLIDIYLSPLQRRSLLNELGTRWRTNKDQLEEVRFRLDQMCTFVKSNVKRLSPVNQKRDRRTSKAFLSRPSDVIDYLDQQVQLLSILAIYNDRPVGLLQQLSEESGKMVKEWDSKSPQRNQRLCRELIHILLNAPDAEKLIQQVKKSCPSFFRPRDLQRHQAMDILKNLPVEVETKANALSMARELLVESAAHVPIHRAFQVFKKEGDYRSMVSIAFAHARCVDVDNLSLSYLREAEENENHPGNERLKARMEYYQNILDAFQELWRENDDEVKEKLMDAVVQQRDDCFQYVLYRWFLDSNLGEELIQYNHSPLLEEFLQSHSKHPLNMRLLAAYYERMSEYDKATKIYKNLSTTNGNSDLEQRLRDLRKALECQRKRGLLDETIVYQIVLGELQEELLSDVRAHEQLYTVDVIRNFTEEINSRLYDENEVGGSRVGFIQMKQLYKAASRYDRWETQLKVLHATDHGSNEFEERIKKLWNNIIDFDVKDSDSEHLADQINDLSQLHPSTAFPLPHLISRLEDAHMQLKDVRDDLDWVYGMFLPLPGVEFSSLVQIYDQISKDTQSEEKRAYLYGVIYTLIDEWTNYYHTIERGVDREEERRKMTRARIDHILGRAITELNGLKRLGSREEGRAYQLLVDDCKDLLTFIYPNKTIERSPHM
ncbi:nuclear pore complex protein, partial [Planoprotostelium fungivorum]